MGFFVSMGYDKHHYRGFPRVPKMAGRYGDSCNEPHGFAVQIFVDAMGQ